MKRATLRTVLIHLLLIFGAAVMMYPLLFAVFASLNSPADYIRSSSLLPVPSRVTFENYAVVFHPKVLALLLGSLGVTLLRIVWFTFFNGAIALLLGYVFARLRFRGKNIVFWLLMASMLVPGIVFLIPTFVMMAHWPLAGGNSVLGQGGSGLVNQLPALLLPGLFNVYFIFLLRQSFATIPIEYEEAARLEGANFVQILLHVYLPMLKAVNAVVAISTVVNVWNEYTWPLMSVIGNRDLWPTSLLVQRLMAGGLPSDVAQGVLNTTTTTLTNTPLILTFGVLVTVPAVLFFLAFQRYFVEGLQGVGIKG